MPLRHGLGDYPKEFKTAMQLLISANHILHYHGLVDAFGHISIRHPKDPKLYIIAGYDPGAPALVSSHVDFIEYKVADSEPAYPPQPKGYSERFIHGEIYLAYPTVQCVVHSHSEAVIPFTAAGQQVKPVFHMAGFLGTGPPTFVYPSFRANLPKDMLIRNAELGQMLAMRFSSSYQDSQPIGPGPSVVLQHKHGFTCIGDSIQQAVYRAIYTQKNCSLLKDAIDIAGGDESKIDYLTPGEAESCAKIIGMTQDKAFRLWLREVEVNPLYRNAEGMPSALPVGGIVEG
jgi:ribulose-5-phosphate 4-epimerase/fuculose-1-phosphate aldolase